MRTFKGIDLGMQVAIVATAVTFLFFDPFMGVLIFFFGLLAWDVLSLVIHLFLPLPPKLGQKRTPLLVHTAVIILYPVLAIWVHFPTFSGVLYVGYALGLAIYYLILCYRELRYLNDLRDQVKLIDVQHH